MRLLDLNRGVVLACMTIAASTACGGDFHVDGDGKGLSGSGGKKGAGGDSADSGPSSGGSDADGGGSGGGSGHSGTTGRGGANAGGNTSVGGADAGSDGGAESGGSTNGGSGNGGTASGGNGSTASGGTSNGGTASGGTSNGGSGGATGAGAHPQFVKDYDRKCTYDSQCTLVYQGNDVCTCDAQCSNASIATSALDKWNKDRQAMMCVALPCSLQNCPSMVASCGSNVCYARKPVVIDASHYDQSCLNVSDCTTIPTGEVCSPCQCSKGAVSTKGYQDYLKDKQNVQCSPGPVACDCAPPPNQTLTCVLSISGSGLGKCTLTTGAVMN